MNRIVFQCLLLLAATLACLGAQAHASFPRLPGMQAGQHCSDGPEYRHRGARPEIATQGLRRAWARDRDDDMRGAVRRFRQLNPGIPAGRYALLNEASGRAGHHCLPRFDVARAPMNDGHFSHAGHARGYGAMPGIDEYDADLGHPDDGPREKPWNDEVYRRRFEKDMALVNPGNHVRHAATGPGRLHGHAMSSPNSGRPASAATFGPCDVVLLLAYRERASDPSQSEPE